MSELVRGVIETQKLAGPFNKGKGDFYVEKLVLKGNEYFKYTNEPDGEHPEGTVVQLLYDLGKDQRGNITRKISKVKVLDEDDTTTTATEEPTTETKQTKTTTTKAKTTTRQSSLAKGVTAKDISIARQNAVRSVVQHYQGKDVSMDEIIEVSNKLVNYTLYEPYRDAE